MCSLFQLQLFLLYFELLENHQNVIIFISIENKQQEHKYTIMLHIKTIRLSKKEIGSWKLEERSNVLYLSLIIESFSNLCDLLPSNLC